MKEKVKNNRGFTLIELLAVVVIMGILSVVAVSAVTKIMENARKDMFVNTAKEYANSVKTLWKSENLRCGSKGIISSDVPIDDYYILIDSTNQDLLEDGGKSSWGNKEVKGYVKAKVYQDSKNNKEVKFYVALSDGIHGIKEKAKPIEELNRKDMIMNLASDDSYFNKSGVNTCVIEGTGLDKNSSETPEIPETPEITSKPIEMVSGNKENPVKGNVFKIKDEEFYVISSTATTITGLAKYNLYVGNEYSNNFISYGAKATNIQNSAMRGWISSPRVYKGVTSFGSSNEYSGSIVEGYVNKYKEILKSYGVTIVEARLITYSEIVNIFHCKERKVCPNTYPWLYQTSYWTSSKYGANDVWNINSDGNFRPFNYGTAYNRGVRPVIKINKSEI